MNKKKSGQWDLELQKRLHTLMFLRVLFVSVILGALIIIRFRGTHVDVTQAQSAPYLLLAVIYFTNIVYIFLIKYLGRIRLQAYYQLFFDTVFITVFIYTTGGIDSIFSFLFILNIISGSILFSRKGGIIIASASSILYGLMLDLHYYGLIHPLGSRVNIVSDSYSSSFLFYTILVNMAAFYLVGYLSGFLAEQTKKSRAELKETKLDLDKLEILHESIINSITSGLIVLDDKERVILFNPTAGKILGNYAHQISGLSLASALPVFWQHVQSVLKIRSSVNIPPFMDIPYGTPDGAKIYLRLSISPLRYLSSGKGGKIIVFQDVTEIKRIEENMKKVEGLALVGEMAAGIAHEIRNPMASISGSIEVLKEGLVWDSTENRLMAIVSREIDRLDQLISDFLIFARPKEIKWKTFDLNRVITESLDLFKNGQRWNENVRVLTHFNDSVMIESDPDQIKQVLWNLFLNACDAMPGGGTLDIVTKWVFEAQESASRDVAIIIRDTGGGFESKTLSKLFTPFFTTKEGGSGLGLATVKRIVDQLQGRVSGNNYPDGGAEIVIILPGGSRAGYSRPAAGIENE
ncbi:MAG: PAS domain S-box protein [Deltaproteobacteria bacterium]|nr:PAS domain S-box protein [Deltaproteobacteria bacterium]